MNPACQSWGKKFGVTYANKSVPKKEQVHSRRILTSIQKYTFKTLYYFFYEDCPMLIKDEGKKKWRIKANF